MKKYKNNCFLEMILLGITACCCVFGYFLSAILIPVQDYNLLSQEEILELQKSVAINYSLGNALIHIGKIGIVISCGLLLAKCIYLLFQYIRKKKL